MAYRTSAAPEYKYYQRSRVGLWWDDWGGVINQIFIWIAAIILTLFMLSIFAAATQWVVNGLAGRDVGNFFHYWVGFMIFYLLRSKSPAKKED